MLKFINLLEVSAPSLSDSGLQSVMEKVVKLVNNPIMPIIYVVLALFLVVKGALLGVQIVKAADEPQVRQEKIGSLKWLIIGVAIAYGVAGVAQIVMNAFASSFTL